MRYNWQHPNWPHFTYNAEPLCELNQRFLQEASRFSHKITALQTHDQKRVLVDIFLSEALNTSELEGEKLDRNSVRSSLKRHLGLKTEAHPVNKQSAAMATLMLDVRQQFSAPLSLEMLHKWHQLVMPETGFITDMVVGGFRTDPTPMQIVSGPIGRQQVHFVAPPAHTLDQSMAGFIDWVNSQAENEPNVSALPTVFPALAHLYFESLHPYDDGNGRVGRALAEHCMGKSLGFPACLSLSSAIMENRDNYYEALHRASRPDMDVTEWLVYFSDICINAQKTANQTIEHVINVSRLWERIDPKSINDRQQKAIRKLVDAGPEGFEGGLKAKNYMSMTKCAKATATRDLAHLVSLGVLTPSQSGGRSTSYQLNLRSVEQENDILHIIEGVDMPRP